MKEEPAEDNEARELLVTRIFDAPLELVWKAWTDCGHLMRWWGPSNFTSPTCKIDLRVGGGFLFCMKSPEGREYWSTGVYREIIPMERLVYTDSFADAHGNRVPASHYGMPGNWPSELLVTVTFEDLNGKTRLTIYHVGIPTRHMNEMAATGWSQSLEKLAESLR